MYHTYVAWSSNGRTSDFESDYAGSSPARASNIEDSSNGRTVDSESAYSGSSPLSSAKHNSALVVQGMGTSFLNCFM